jgi:hypothetical protein
MKTILDPSLADNFIYPIPLFIFEDKGEKIYLQKVRCSSHCTWQWWSRYRRKKEGHSRKKRKAPSRLLGSGKRRGNHKEG